MEKKPNLNSMDLSAPTNTRIGLLQRLKSDIRTYHRKMEEDIQRQYDGEMTVLSVLSKVFDQEDPLDPYEVLDSNINYTGIPFNK